MIEFVSTVGRAGSIQDTVLICTDSVFLRDYVVNKLRETLGVKRDYCITATTANELKKARGDALAAPIEGKRWLVIVDMDKIGIDVYKKEARRVNDNSFTLLMTSKYGVFAKLAKDRELIKQKFLLPYYFGSFAKGDITYISADYDIVPALVAFLEKNYRWDVNKVMTLFNMAKQGVHFDKKQDIIDAIGNGGITPASIIIELLTNTPDTKRKANALRKSVLTHLTDISRKQTYRSIYTQMYVTLLGIMDVKSLRINGNFMGLFKDIPEGYDTKRIMRLRRYFWVIDSIPTSRVMYLMSLFKNQTGYGKQAEVECLKIVFEYLSNWSV